MKNYKIIIVAMILCFGGFVLIFGDNIVNHKLPRQNNIEEKAVAEGTDVEEATSDHGLKDSEIDIEDNHIEKFDPLLVKLGEQIRRLDVVEVNNNSAGLENILFKGTFTLTGEAVINTIGGSEYAIICDSEEVYKRLPFSISWDIDFTRYFPFCIENDQKILEILSDEILQELSNQEGKRYRINLECDGFLYVEHNIDCMGTISINKVISIDELEIDEEMSSGINLNSMNTEIVRIDIIVAKVISINNDGSLIIEDVNGGSLVQANDTDAFVGLKRLRPWKRYRLVLDSKQVVYGEFHVGDFVKVLAHYNQEDESLIQKEDDYVSARYVDGM